MISKEKLRQRLYPAKPAIDPVMMELQVMGWQVREALNNSQYSHRIIAGLAQHLGLRSY